MDNQPIQLNPPPLTDTNEASLARVAHPMATIRVLLVGAQNLVRVGIESLLRSAPGFELAGIAENDEDALWVAMSCRPDVITIHVPLSFCGLDAARAILTQMPNVRLLVLSTYRDSHVAAELSELGAAGLLPTQITGVELVRAIRDIASGRTVFPARVAPSAVDPQLSRMPKGRKPPRLTSREVDVLKLIAQGLANKQIADRLSISIKTVEKHRQKVMDKLKAHETASLTCKAISMGLVQL